jgi:hypothetical protein
MKTKERVIEIRRDDDFFGAVLTCAVRYSIGRATYMPGLVTDWIMGHCAGMLCRKTLGVMLRDIDDAAKQDGLGMECDARTWMNFRTWILKEMEALDEQKADHA